MPVKKAPWEPLPTTTFGQRLKLARSIRGMQQRDLAAKLEVSQSLIAAWETQGTDPRLSTIIRLAAATDMDPSWLAFGNGPNPAQ